MPTFIIISQKTTNVNDFFEFGKFIKKSEYSDLSFSEKNRKPQKAVNTVCLRFNLFKLYLSIIIVVS